MSLPSARLASLLKKVPDYKFAKHAWPRAVSVLNIVSCLLRWVVSTIERELKSCRRGVLYPSISVMPNEYNSGEFPLLYWLVLPFCGIHMICQVNSGLAWNFTEQFESVAELSLSPGWCRTNCLFYLPTNECKSCNVVLYQNWFHWKAQRGMICFNGLLTGWSFTLQKKTHSAAVKYVNLEALF